MVLVKGKCLFAMVCKLMNHLDGTLWRNLRAFRCANDRAMKQFLAVFVGLAIEFCWYNNGANRVFKLCLDNLKVFYHVTNILQWHMGQNSLRISLLTAATNPEVVKTTWRWQATDTVTLFIISMRGYVPPNYWKYFSLFCYWSQHCQVDICIELSAMLT